MLRILLGVNLLAFAAALIQGTGIGDSVQRYVDMAAWVQPLLLLNILLLALLANGLRRLRPWIGWVVVIFLAGERFVIDPLARRLSRGRQY